jgi:hypothetical protein
MIKLKDLMQETVKKVSLQHAIDNKLFGPVYHGTSQETLDKINSSGFEIYHGNQRSGNVAHGYESSNYYGGIPAPIHHLGFGVYFTTSKLIAKKYAGGTTKKMQMYYLDIPSQETINFGANRTMMKWWMENGYNYRNIPETMFGNEKTNLKLIQEERYNATINLTNTLKSKYDAVWFKGKGIYRLLDGDQICVYDTNNIYQFDKSLIVPGEIGSKVVAKVAIDRFNNGKNVVPIGTKGIILKKENTKEFLNRYPKAAIWVGDAENFYDIKWKIGGHMPQVLDTWIEVL